MANEGKKPTEFLGMRQSSQSRYNHLPCREYRTQGLPSCVLVILNSHSLGSYQLLQTIILRLSFVNLSSVSKLSTILNTTDQSERGNPPISNPARSISPTDACVYPPISEG